MDLSARPAGGRRSAGRRFERGEAPRRRRERRSGGRRRRGRRTGEAAGASRTSLPLAALASSSREAAATLLPALRSLAAKDPRRYGAMLPEAWERLWQGKVVVERPRQQSAAEGGSGSAAAVAAEKRAK